MSVKIEKQENSKVVLEFTMKNEEFRKAVDAAFKKNAKYFKVPGFRNGKVPRAVVEKMYGEECLYETVIEEGAEVNNSVIMANCLIQSGAVVNNAVVLEGTTIEEDEKVGKADSEKVYLVSQDGILEE